MRTPKQMRHYVLIALSGMFLGAEMVASHVTQSLVLVTDAYHMLYNFVSLILLVISYQMSTERTLHNTFGWVRIEVLGILINTLFLFSLYFAVFIQSLQTMFHASHEITKPLYPLLVLIFGILGIILNLLSFFLIGGYTHHQNGYLSIQGTDVHVSYVVSSQENVDGRQLICSTQKKTEEKMAVKGYRLIDLARDASCCLLVTVCACVIYFGDGPVADFADPVLTLVAVALLVATMCPFLKETGLILLQNVPHHIDIMKLKVKLLDEFPAILNVHDLHVWRLTSSQIIATTHIILSSPAVYCRISSKVDQFFQQQGITLATIQPEFCENREELEKKDNECILMCSKNCQALTCCNQLASNHDLHHRHVGMNKCSHSHATSRKGTDNDGDDFQSELDFTQILLCQESNV